MKVYIASPYSHKDKGLQKLRSEMVTYLTAELLERTPGLITFGPITESHAYQEYRPSLGTGFEDWEKKDKLMLDNSDEIWVIMMKGWNKSIGVISEIEYAEKKKIPIRYLDPFEICPQLKELL